MKEHLAGERPKPAEPSQFLCLCIQTTQQRGGLLHSILCHIYNGEVNTGGLVQAADVQVCVSEWERDGERDSEGRADLQCVRQQGQPIPGEVLAF